MDISKKIQQELFNNISSSTKSGNILDWISENRTIKGTPWKWVLREYTLDGREIIKDFRYLIPIYLDPHDTIIIKKARQLAFSEYIINKHMYFFDRFDHTTGIHVFPKESQAKTFSNMRLTPLFNKTSSPKLYHRLSDPELVFGSAMQAAANVKIKQFVNGSNYVLSFIAGSGSKSTDALSITADCVALDEAADLPADKISDVIECMSASIHKMLTILGTPDFAGTEFDRRYEESDQREWIVTCPQCGMKQQLKFDKTIIPITEDTPKSIPRNNIKYYYACTACKAELNRTADCGEWIPQNPDSEVHGYHPTQLIASWISADEIMRKKRDNVKYPHKFANFVLGETYSGGSKPITLQKLLNCKIDADSIDNKEFKYITVGADWGNQSHYVVLGAQSRNKIYILDFGIWSDIKVKKHATHASELMDIWGAQLGVFDSGYGKAQTQELFVKHPNKAFACFYSKTSVVNEFKMIDEYKGTPLPQKDFQYHVIANHTAMCDAVLSIIDEKRLKIPIDNEDELMTGISPVRTMLDSIASARVLTQEVSGKTTKRWVITPSHYFAALAYGLIAIDNLYDDIYATGDEIGNEFFAPKGYM